jgi:hypothetical protein
MTKEQVGIVYFIKPQEYRVEIPLKEILNMNKELAEYFESNFTDNEVMRMVNLYARRITDNGSEYYGKRDNRIMKKINRLVDNDDNFLNLYKKMDYGLGKFTQRKRE